MKKIGILTFHYSNNYGGVLQALALQRVLEADKFECEIINFVPSTYRINKIISNLGIRRNPFKNNINNLNIIKQIKKIIIMKRYNSIITHKFDLFRLNEMKMSRQVDEFSLEKILSNYDSIIVGSDQIWNPGQRNKPEYFLDFNENYSGRKISYSADSSVSEIYTNQRILKKALSEFSYISVRNKHSYDFVFAILNKESEITVDPTLLYDFQVSEKKIKIEEPFILTYILGKEISGSNKKAIEKIKRVYGDLNVYSILIPTQEFNIPTYADKVFYDLDPNEWLSIFKKAAFVFTDSYHGTIFSLKFHIPFLAYYTETLRSTRFIDLGKRYKLEKYIIESALDIDVKNCLIEKPNFTNIDICINEHIEKSKKFLKVATNDKIN